MLDGVALNAWNTHTLKLTELKLENHTLSKSEKAFFEDERTLKKNYLKPIKKKEL